MAEMAECFSCPKGLSLEVVYVATVPHKDGNGKIAFAAPLCRMHSNFALIAGWNPIHPIGSEDGQSLLRQHGFGRHSTNQEEIRSEESKNG